MKQGTRLYINLLNKCNTNCPFCCMYSGTNKDRFLAFEQFKNIIDNTKGNFELQLEGGEPLLHESIFLFMEYAVNTKRCNKILVLTNGFLLEQFLKHFISFSEIHNILIEFKISINYWLIQEWNKEHIESFVAYLAKIDFATKFIPNIKVCFNVRKRYNDDWIEKELETYQIKEDSNIFYLQSYGKLKDSEEYDKPVIVQNIDNWSLYASDGTCFGQDLIARSEYEK